MLGVVVCTHSDFAEGIRNAVEMILGEQEDFDVVCFREGEDMLELADRIKAVTARYEDAGEKYVVCADLFGATPFNASAAALAEADTSVITGVNLPILLQLLGERDSYEDYDAFLLGTMESAKDSMKIVKMREMFA
jgi:mannose/fructose/sorbose-specific phosphotransferase system IIA component